MPIVSTIADPVDAGKLLINTGDDYTWVSFDATDLIVNPNIFISTTAVNETYFLSEEDANPVSEYGLPEIDPPSNNDMYDLLSPYIKE